MGRYSEEVMEQVRRRNYQRWLQKAKERHGDRFNYSLSAIDFQSQKEPEVRIICPLPLHGEFKVTPFNHLRFKGGGCKKCGNEAKGAPKKATHARRFQKYFDENLSHRLEQRSPYVGVKDPVIVWCRIHKKTTPVTPDHLMHGGGYGCDDCAAEEARAAKLLKLEDVQAEFAGKFPHHIQITDIRFDGEQSEIKVKCERHEPHWVRKGYLTKSQYGCPDCGNEVVGYSGYRLKQLIESGARGRESRIGVMEVEVFGIRTLKVGTTTRTLEDRYKWHLKKIFFEGTLYEIDVLILENDIHKKFKDHVDLRIRNAGMRKREHWSGWTECYMFGQKAEIIAFIKERLDKLKLETPDYSDALEKFERFDFSVRQVGREKDLSNLPQPVICVETGEWFPTQTNAARKMRTTQGNISLVLSGKRRVAGGKHWVRAEDYDAGDAEDL